MRVVSIDPSADPRWDAFVAGHTSASPFHRSAWLRVLHAENGQGAVGLAVERDGELAGVLPLVSTRGLPLGAGAGAGGRRLASLPRTPAGGPVAVDDEARALLVRSAIERTPPGCRIQLKLSEPVPDGAVPGLVTHPWRMTYVVALPDRVDDVRFGPSRHHTRVLAATRKALDSGMTIRPASTPADLRAWYRLYLETMRHHMVPARPWRLFEALWRELRPAGMLELLLAERGGRMLAGNLLVGDGVTSSYLFNGADRRTLEDRPNDLLHAEAIRRLTASGHRRYDLGEVVEGHEGLARFKRKLGAREVRLQRAYWPAPDHAPDPGDGGPLRAHLERAWRRAPLRVTAAAGSIATRYL